MNDKAFWQTVIANNYAIPDKEKLLVFTDELLDYLAHPDPELRDEFGYNILTRWIAVYGYHSTEQLIVMGQWLLEQLDKGIGEINTDTVFLRSYSAAVLSLIVYRDVKEQFMSTRDVLTILETAQSYLLFEQDTRAHDPVKGWINAIANVTGLLRYLAMHPALSKEQLQGILETVSRKVCQPAEEAFNHDEEDRLARVVIPIMMRNDLDKTDYALWFNEIKMWLTTHETDGDYNATYNFTYQNIKRFLRALHVQVLLANRVTDAATESQVDLLDAIREFSL